MGDVFSDNARQQRREEAKRQSFRTMCKTLLAYLKEPTVDNIEAAKVARVQFVRGYGEIGYDNAAAITDLRNLLAQDVECWRRELRRALSYVHDGAHGVSELLAALKRESPFAKHDLFFLSVENYGIGALRAESAEALAGMLNAAGADVSPGTRRDDPSLVAVPRRRVRKPREKKS